MSARCHGNREVKTEHAVTKAMVQSTFVLIWISTEAFLFSLQFVGTENRHFSKYAHEVMGLMVIRIGKYIGSYFFDR
jgi:hypothetical protein